MNIFLNRHFVWGSAGIVLLIGISYFALFDVPFRSSQLQTRLLLEPNAWEWHRFEASTSPEAALQWMSDYLASPAASDESEESELILQREEIDVEVTEETIEPVEVIQDQAVAVVEEEVEVEEVVAIEVASEAAEPVIEVEAMVPEEPMVPPAPFIEQTMMLASAFENYYGDLEEISTDLFLTLPTLSDLNLQGNDFPSYFYSFYPENVRFEAPVVAVGFLISASEVDPVPALWLGWRVLEENEAEESEGDNEEEMDTSLPPLPDFPLDALASAEWRDLSELRFKLANSGDDLIVSQGQTQLLGAYWMETSGLPSLDATFFWNATPYVKEDSNYAIPLENLWIMKGDVPDPGWIYDGVKYFRMDPAPNPLLVRVFLLLPAGAPSGVYHSFLRYTPYSSLPDAL